jgi:methionine-rich copper-binding protein CopC
MTTILSRSLAAAVLVAIVAACSTPAASAPAASAGASAPAASGNRPSSPAVVTIIKPTSGESVTGTSVHVALTLTGAQIVSATTTNIRPDQGHVHLYVDNVLVSMNYGLEQDLPVHAGTYVLKAEFVAADHAPFNPRVWSPEVFFTVK